MSNEAEASSSTSGAGSTFDWSDADEVPIHDVNSCVAQVLDNGRTILNFAYFVPAIVSVYLSEEERAQFEKETPVKPNNVVRVQMDADHIDRLIRLLLTNNEGGQA